MNETPKPVGAQRNAGGQQEPEDWTEERNPPWYPGGAIDWPAHVRGSFFHRVVPMHETRKKAQT